MLPLSLLRSAQGQQILVELKNGETYNGTLNTIDNWMNLALRDVTLTSSDGKRFWRVSELYVRGNTVKYLQVPDVVLDVVADEKQAREAARNANRNRQQRSRAGRGGRARRGGTAGREQGAYQQQHGGRRYNQQQQYAQRAERRPPGFESD